jgi:hypothetical protein
MAGAIADIGAVQPADNGVCFIGVDLGIGSVGFGNNVFEP